MKNTKIYILREKAYEILADETILRGEVLDARETNKRIDEIFAELIVRSCCDAADVAHDSNCPYPGDYVGEEMGYGVDEGISNWRLT